MDIEEYKRRFAEDSSPGWDSLNLRLREVYGDLEPQHWERSSAINLAVPIHLTASALILVMTGTLTMCIS